MVRTKLCGRHRAKRRMPAWSSFLLLSCHEENAFVKQTGRCSHSTNKIVPGYKQSLER